jgi:hypothetical protein
MEQLGCHWKDFNEIWYLNIFQKSLKKIRVWLKSDTDNRYFTWRPVYIYDSIWFLLRVRNVSDKVVEKIKTRISFSVTLFPKLCHFLDDVEKYGRSSLATGDILWHTHFACWITKTTHTLRVCNTYRLSMATVVMQTCLSVMVYIHCLSCIIL